MSEFLVQSKYTMKKMLIIPNIQYSIKVLISDLIYFISVLFIIFPSYSNSQDIKTITPYKQTPIVQVAEHPVKNIEGDIIDYTSREQTMKNNLVYSPKQGAYYSENASEKIMEEMKGVKDFDGDEVLNPHFKSYVSTAGEHHYNYYGSGDVNNDGEINQYDYFAMQSGVSNDRSDVDGDGVSSTSNDQELLYNYITDQIPYLPAHEDVLKTEAEKIFWMESIKAIDQTNTLPYVPRQFECGEFSTQINVNDPGVRNISNSTINFNVIDTTENFRFNGRSYQISTQALNGESHSANGVLVGNNALNFNDWYFFEPQTDERIYPGDWNMHPNGYVHIKRLRCSVSYLF